MKPLTRTQVFRATVAAIALHVADDNFLQPAAGTSAGDHLVSGLFPSRSSRSQPGGSRASAAAARAPSPSSSAPLGIAIGIEAIHYANQVGASGDDFTGFLTIPAGLTLLGLGAATLWRTRRTEGNRAWRYGRRGLFGLAGALVAFVLVFPIGFAYVTTHTARAASRRTSSARRTRTSRSRPATA